MSLSAKNVIIDWKRLWQLVSGIHYETPEATVEQELLKVSKELQDGLLQFQHSNASKVNLEDMLKDKKQEKLLPFTQRLQEFLDLEATQCWEILCYYLTNEYRGSASLLTTLISTESNMTKLLDDIWGYYSLERMIVLKIVKNLLIFYMVPNHPYQHEYKAVVDKITLAKLRDSYIKQLEYLINESPPSKLVAGEFFNYQAKLVLWSERNAREINEVLHILLLICEDLRPGLEQVKQLFGCFKQHLFGKQQRYLDHAHSQHSELITRLTYSEVILFLNCIDFPNIKESQALVQDIVKALDKDISRMYHNVENGPILFAWMLLNLRANDEVADELLRRYQQFGKRALDLNCFCFLRSLIASPMFSDDSLIARMARKTVYNLLSHMCDLFDEDGSCARYPFIYELLCELLSTPALAKEFTSQTEGGVRSLYNTLLEVFPIDFVNLSNLANALTKAGHGNYIKAALESLPIFTDLYDEAKYSLRALQDNEYILKQQVSPYARIDFTIAKGTSVAVMSRPEGYCVHFRASVNYFNVLHHEINCLLAETTHQPVECQKNERVRRVEAGLKYLESALKRTKALSDISVEMVHPTEMCIDILNKFKTVQNPPVELLASCLNLCTALLPLVDTEIFTRVINLHILPALTNDSLNDYKKYAHGVCFDSRLVGSYLVNMEKKLERYDFLLAYLNFLRTYTKLQKSNFFQVEIPGLVFLLREVFSHIHSWHFQKQSDKNKIYVEIMGFICDILDTVTTATGKPDQLLRDICVYSLLNMENGLILLRFIALGNAYLQHSMEMESNWILQQSHGLVLLVRLAMRILMQLLRLRGSIFKAEELSPLEALIYTQPKQRDTLRIIPVVTSYMNNIFDRWLPILSCRLLKRIALEFNMSLLACLDMEPDQIRLTFLHKLPDELESDSLKIAILELVEACIEKQPGVTEAFFKVNYEQEKRIFGKESNTQIADSILTFMEDYLEAVAKEPYTIENALPSKIMNLFHSLWKQNMQILVQELTSQPEFWQKLSSPLFDKLRPNMRAYTQLFNIFAIEMFSKGEASNDKLKDVLTKFFEPDCFNKWLAHIFDLPKTPAILPISADLLGEDMPDWLCRLQAFKSFILITLKQQPQFIKIPDQQSKSLAKKCLEVMVERAKYSEDLRPFIILAELYLFIMLSLKHSFSENPQEDRLMLSQLVQVLGRVATCYEDLHPRAKDACLAIAIKCSSLLSEELLNNSSSALNFLHSVVSIVCTELQTLEKSVKAELREKKVIDSSGTNSSTDHANYSTNSTILCLNLLKNVATIFHNDGPGNWDIPFITNKVFQRLLSCTGYILQLNSKQNLTVELLDVLIVFAKGNCSTEFLHCDVGDYLWLKLLPPKELLQANYTLNKPCLNEWTVEKWWRIYARGIELVAIIFQKHKNFFLKDVLQFVGIHEEYLLDSLLLAKQSLQPLAMQLIKNSVTLLSTLVEFEKEWRMDHSQSLFNLMRGVQVLLGHSIAMFHQPKNLKCLVAGRRAQLDIWGENSKNDMADEVIAAFNDLTEIIILCAKCLQRFSPDLIALLCEPEILVSKWEPIFEIHFGAPKLSENAVALSFGQVLSVVGVFTKALNLQNYGFHEVHINYLPSNGSDASPSPANARSSARAHSPFSKSLSVASATSVNCASNELLSNLDGELCLLALEHILMLAASQSMLALKNPYIPFREKQLIRREISSELLSYHEFVRKKVFADHREHKDMWQRRKHGLVYMTSVQARGDDDPQGSGSGRGDFLSVRTSGDAHRRHPDDLRINVVRRQHLQRKQPCFPAAGGNFDMTQVISPIEPELLRNPVGTQRTEEAAVASTPLSGRLAAGSSGQSFAAHPKRVFLADEVVVEAEEEIEMFPPEEPSYSPLSYVQLVEEDFLHFMSNLFTVICQSD